jgi:hypothetical protein
LIFDGSTAGGVLGSKGGGSVGFLTWSSVEDESPGLDESGDVEICVLNAAPSANALEALSNKKTVTNLPARLLRLFISERITSSPLP